MPEITVALDWFETAWRDWSTLIRLGLIIFAAIVLRIALLLSVKRIVAGIISGAKKGTGKKAVASSDASPLAKARLVQRAQTMGSVLSNFIRWTIYIVAVTMILSELGVAVGALVAGAGILGAALGFGAQSLVRDLITGLFIVFEDQYGVGDSVDLGQATGVVENVGLRVTQVRDSSGTLWYVRNGEVVRVGNSSQGWSRVVLDVPLEYQTDIAKATAAISNAASQIALDETLAPALIGTHEVWGIEALNGAQVVIRLAQQVKPEKQDAVARAMRAQIKAALDREQIKLATGNQSVYVEIAGKAAQ
ncbi:mechanosensitive ion channel family protein [Rhodoluna sp. KAS3]|uniref:mechanosensitive ion channel family protein n=1 Tax=Rhodoluna sp. KAS3 TaxID=942880 RepID=UPI00222E3B8A|nr:mechanosensitive ion channel family protein [Rhodoluna sp. KAS3]BDS49204.1 mechanosensitive ion channel protein MscS [Rhodoluna sp. KAS3]